ncbi:MAG: hypothetical protein GX591_13070 [Planctomycetes bacterium]|nr:hypothetical protein [Planctomycetota bacterium]
MRIPAEAACVMIVAAGLWLVGCGPTSTSPVAPALPEGLTSLPATPSYTGTLTASDRRLDDGSYYDGYSIFADQGDRIRVSMVSTAFDPYLVLLSPSGQRWRDDDGGEGNNAFLDVRADASGRYVLAANSYQQAQGSYRLWIDCPSANHREGTAVRLPERVSTVIDGQPVQSGTLTSTDPKLEDDTYYDCYVVQASAGDKITVSMTSGDFDAYLLVRSPSGAVETDDDSGVGTNAVVEIPVADANGLWQIFANSTGSTKAGTYELRIGVQRTNISSPAPVAAEQPAKPEAAGDGTDE